MEINVYVKPNVQIRAFYLFFIISSIQAGVGLMSLPRQIFSKSEYSAWVSVLVAGFIMHVIVFVIFKILNQYENADILGIQQDIFGSWIGKLLGSFYLLFLFATSLSVLMEYVQVIQVFIFPRLPPWILSLALTLLVVYAGLGGLRVVVGVTFVFYLMTSGILLFLYKPALLMDFTQFKPLFKAPPADILQGAYQTSFLYIGLDILFFIYPFIENRKKAQLSAQLGIGMTTFIILLLTIISLGYYSAAELRYTMWPVLGLFKIIAYPIIGRYDVIVIIEWMLVILPTLILLIWIINFGLKRLYSIPRRKGLYVLGILLAIGGGINKSFFDIQKITDKVAAVGIWFLVIYPLILLPLVLIKKKISSRKEIER